MFILRGIKAAGLFCFTEYLHCDGPHPYGHAGGPTMCTQRIMMIHLLLVPHNEYNFFN